MATVTVGRVCLRCQGSFLDIPWREGAAYCCGPAAGEREPVPCYRMHCHRTLGTSAYVVRHRVEGVWVTDVRYYCEEHREGTLACAHEGTRCAAVGCPNPEGLGYVS